MASRGRRASPIGEGTKPPGRKFFRDQRDALEAAERRSRERRKRTRSSAASGAKSGGRRRLQEEGGCDSPLAVAAPSPLTVWNSARSKRRRKILQDSDDDDEGVIPRGNGQVERSGELNVAPSATVVEREPLQLDDLIDISPPRNKSGSRRGVLDSQIVEPSATVAQREPLSLRDLRVTPTALTKAAAEKALFEDSYGRKHGTGIAPPLSGLRYDHDDPELDVRVDAVPIAAALGRDAIAFRSSMPLLEFPTPIHPAVSRGTENGNVASVAMQPPETPFGCARRDRAVPDLPSAILPLNPQGGNVSLLSRGSGSVLVEATPGSEKPHLLDSDRMTRTPHLWAGGKGSVLVEATPNTILVDATPTAFCNERASDPVENDQPGQEPELSPILDMLSPVALTCASQEADEHKRGGSLELLTQERDTFDSVSWDASSSLAGADDAARKLSYSSRWSIANDSGQHEDEIISCTSSQTADTDAGDIFTQPPELFPASPQPETDGDGGSKLTEEHAGLASQFALRDAFVSSYVLGNLNAECSPGVSLSTTQEDIEDWSATGTENSPGVITGADFAVQTVHCAETAEELLARADFTPTPVSSQEGSDLSANPLFKLRSSVFTVPACHKAPEQKVIFARLLPSGDREGVSETQEEVSDSRMDLSGGDLSERESFHDTIMSFHSQSRSFNAVGNDRAAIAERDEPSPIPENLDPSANAHVINFLAEYAAKISNDPVPQHVNTALRRAIKAVEKCPWRITSGEEARARLPGVGDFCSRLIDQALRIQRASEVSAAQHAAAFYDRDLAMRAETPQGVRFAVPAFREIVFRLPAPSPTMLTRQAMARAELSRQKVDIPFDTNYAIFRGLFVDRASTDSLSSIGMLVFQDCVHAHSTRDTVVCRYLDEFFVPESTSMQAHCGDTAQKRWRIDPCSFDSVPLSERDYDRLEATSRPARLSTEYVIDKEHPLRTAVQHWLSQRVAVTRSGVGQPNASDKRIRSILDSSVFILHAHSRAHGEAVTVLIDCYLPKMRCKCCPPPTLGVLRIAATLQCMFSPGTSDEDRVDFSWTKTFAVCVNPSNCALTKHSRIDARMSPLIASCVEAREM